MAMVSSIHTQKYDTFGGYEAPRSQFDSSSNASYDELARSILSGRELNEGFGAAMSKEYVDAKLEASEARTRESIAGLRADMDGKFAKMEASFSRIEAKLDAAPTKAWFTMAGFSMVAILVSVLILSFSRYDAGMRAGSAFDDRVASMEARLDTRIGDKFEEVAKLLKDKPREVVSSKPAPSVEPSQD